MIQLDRDSMRVFGPGDLLLIVVFVLIGEISHGAMPWTVPQIVLETTLTFLIGWVIVAPIGSAYRAETRVSVTASVWSAIASWVGASAVANVIRATPLVHGNASLTFFLVTIAFGGVLFAAWRWLRVRSIAS